MLNQVTFPVRTLRDETTALEAALSVCLAEPTPRAVHRLRTGTRRLEAQLLLLELVPTVPAHREPAATLRRELRRLRRAAGAVRDLDVQGRHLERLATPPLPQSVAAHSDTPESSHIAAGPRTSAETGTTTSDPQSAFGPGSARLARHLGRRRAKAAVGLQRLLGRRQAKAALAAEALLKALQPADGLELTAEHLIRASETVLHRDGLLRGADIGRLDEEELHAVRKSAKLARYLAETMPRHPAVKAAAARFEQLQEAGGLWHDALEITRAARRYLGRRHPLSAALAADRKLHLLAYREILRGLASSEPGPRLISEPLSHAGTAPGRSRSSPSPVRGSDSRGTQPAQTAQSSLTRNPAKRVRKARRSLSAVG